MISHKNSNRNIKGINPKPNILSGKWQDVFQKTEMELNQLKAENEDLKMQVEMLDAINKDLQNEIERFKMHHVSNSLAPSLVSSETFERHGKTWGFAMPGLSH